MRRFPMSSVTYAVPFSTMSVTVLQALGESFSEGEMKFPAALFITTCELTMHIKNGFVYFAEIFLCNNITAVKM